MVFLRYRDFLIFKMAVVCHLGFLKSQYFTGLWGPEGWDASLCEILAKLVNPLQRYCTISISENEGHVPSRIFKVWMFYPVLCGRPLCISETNFTKIGQEVSEMLWFSRPPSWIF